VLREYIDYMQEHEFLTTHAAHIQELSTELHIRDYAYTGQREFAHASLSTLVFHLRYQSALMMAG
jgi:hypothetical protein